MRLVRVLIYDGEELTIRHTLNSRMSAIQGEKSIGGGVARITERFIRLEDWERKDVDLLCVGRNGVGLKEPIPADGEGFKTVG